MTFIWPYDLDLQPMWKIFQMALLLEDNNCAKLFWNPCIIVQVMAQTSSIYDHFDLYLTHVTLTFNLPEKMFQTALFLLEDNNCANYFWNPCINVQVMARTSSIYYLTPVTLTFDLPKNVSNGTSPPQGKQLCHTVLKSMNYCTSYGPDKSVRRTDAGTHWCTHIHRTKIVTTMSRLLAGGLDKNTAVR